MEKCKECMFHQILICRCRRRISYCCELMEVVNKDTKSIWCPDED